MAFNRDPAETIYGDWYLFRNSSGEIVQTYHDCGVQMSSEMVTRGRHSYQNRRSLATHIDHITCDLCADYYRDIDITIHEPLYLATNTIFGIVDVTVRQGAIGFGVDMENSLRGRETAVQGGHRGCVILPAYTEYSIKVLGTS